MKFFIIFCFVFAAAYAQGSIKDVADCFHEKLKECREKCKEKLPEEKRAPVGDCWKAEAEASRSNIRKCLSDKGLPSETPCFKFDHAHHIKAVAGGAAKFSESMREALKEGALCFKTCLDEKKDSIEACQAECPEASDENKEKVKECVQDARGKFPSDTLKSCLSTALGIPTV